MATTKKKTFDAVAESRRWRIQTGRKLRGLSFEQQQALLQRTTEACWWCASDGCQRRARLLVEDARYLRMQ